MSLTKKILIVEGFFVVGVLVFLFFSSAPSQIYPLHGMTIVEPEFNFEIENGEEILISFDEDFTSFWLLEEGDYITLPPGTYYWKVKSKLRESEVKNFTIQSNVAFNIKEKGENYELNNVGNVDLEIGGQDENSESIILERRASKEIEKDNSTYIGEQK